MPRNDFAQLVKYGTSDRFEDDGTQVSVPVTRSVMVNTIIKQCEANQIDLEKVIDDLIDRLNAQEAKVKKEAEMNLTLKKSTSCYTR